MASAAIYFLIFSLPQPFLYFAKNFLRRNSSYRTFTVSWFHSSSKLSQPSYFAIIISRLFNFRKSTELDSVRSEAGESREKHDKLFPSRKKRAKKMNAAKKTWKQTRLRFRREKHLLRNVFSNRSLQVKGNFQTRRRERNEEKGL